MAKIISDQSVLRQISAPLDVADMPKIIEIIKELDLSIGLGVGLAAPQIGIFSRIFIAQLSSSYLAFVNPTIKNTSQGLVPSVEGCLSIPDVSRCIGRAQRVTITADVILSVVTTTPIEAKEMQLSDLDAFIVQHENDHLDGKLIIDHPTVPTREQKAAADQLARMKKIHHKRHNKSNKTQQTETKVNPSKAKKEAKQFKSFLRRQNKCVEIQETRKAQLENLFDDTQK